jgi:6-phosphogluconolactonase
MNGPMKKAEPIVFKDLETLSQFAAERFAALTQAADKFSAFFTAISGGGTPRHLYQILAEPPYSNSLPWSRIQFYWCDERCVPPDHEESNYALANELLFSKVDLPSKNVHRIHGELGSTKASADYTEELISASAYGFCWPRFDLVLLGMGSDGHIASLFPGPISKIEQSSPVMAVTAQYEERPADRVTLTPMVFNTAQNIIFLVSGINKAVALRSIMTSSGNHSQWPALRIQPKDGTITWLVDQEAASLLHHIE